MRSDIFYHGYAALDNGRLRNIEGARYRESAICTVFERP